jgi:hypothetical protein
MKLQTLNVDVAVNAKTMERGLREAERKLQNFGGKGAAFLGGGIGKVGALGSLGGAAGTGAIAAAGIGAAVMAPFKLGGFVVEAFADSTERARKAVEAYENDFTKNIYDATGVTETFARRLAEGAEAAQQAAASQKGWVDTFFGAMSDEQGRLGGVGGFVSEELGQGGGDLIKEWLAFLGAALGGKSTEEAAIEAQMATSRNPSGYANDLAAARAAREQYGAFGADAQVLPYLMQSLEKTFRDLME